MAHSRNFKQNTIIYPRSVIPFTNLLPIIKSQAYIRLNESPVIIWNVTKLINNAYIELTDNRTLQLSAINGSCGTLIVKQDVVGGRTLILPENSKVINGGDGIVVLESTPNSYTILTFTYDGTYYYWNYGKNYT